MWLLSVISTSYSDLGLKILAEQRKKEKKETPLAKLLLSGLLSSKLTLGSLGTKVKDQNFRAWRDVSGFRLLQVSIQSP